MRTSVETLDGNQIRLTVDVDDDELAKAEKETIDRLTRDARVPGFRPGKVPRRVIEARLGHKGVREEALRDVLPRLYGEAVRESELDVITAPQIDITSGEESGPVSFAALVEVRPLVAIPGYQGLVVTIPTPVVSDAEVDAQIDRMREQFATLVEVSRPARTGDVITMDVHGSRGGQPAEGLVADDLVYELGTRGIAEGVDGRLAGAKVGDIFELDAEDTPGGPAHLRIFVKQVREKELPKADDAFAKDASEFESLDELQTEISTNLAELKHRQAAVALRGRALDALADLVAEELPIALVADEAQRLFDNFIAGLTRQQIPLSVYLEATGMSQEDMFNEFESQAQRDVRADLALRALALAEGLEVDESELDEEIVHLAEHARTSPAEMRKTFEQRGGLAGLRSQIKSAKALRWLVEHVSIVDDEGKPVDRSLLQLDEDDGHQHSHEDIAVSGPDSEEESK